MSRQELIRDAENELAKFIRGIKTGFWKEQGYTEQEIQDHLSLCRKEVAYMKKEISHSEYREAYLKVYGKKEVV
jgi:hypothetical protein